MHLLGQFLVSPWTANLRFYFTPKHKHVIFFLIFFLYIWNNNWIEFEVQQVRNNNILILYIFIFLLFSWCVLFFLLFQNVKPSICLTKELKISIGSLFSNSLTATRPLLLPIIYPHHIEFTKQNTKRLPGLYASAWWAAVWLRETECRNNCKLKIINFTLTCDIDRTPRSADWIIHHLKPGRIGCQWYFPRSVQMRRKKIKCIVSQNANICGKWMPDSRATK